MGADVKTVDETWSLARVADVNRYLESLADARERAAASTKGR